MSPLRTILLFTAASVGFSASLLAAPPQPKGFDGLFGVLKNRNIFDSQRQPGAQAQATPAVTRADFAALTGIMVTPEKVLAFFSGSRPEFNAVVAPNGMIAGAVIMRIAPDFIEVKRGAKTVAVAIGNTVPLDANSASIPAPAMEAPTSPAPSNPTTSTASPGASPTGPAPDREAVMRRMMEKRQKELSK